MSRLTKKDYKRWEHCTGYYNKKNAQHLTKIEHKLGKLEDLEEELGCPLEVVFEAYKKGIVDKYGNEWIVECNCQSEMMCSLKNDFDDSWYETDGFEFKDYQKTWWLKGENHAKN